MFVVKSIHIQINNQVMDISVRRGEIVKCLICEELKAILRVRHLSRIVKRLGVVIFYGERSANQ